MLGDGPSLDPLMVLQADREIRNLRARYWRLADTKAWEEYSNLFTEDAIWTAHAEKFYCAGREEIARKVPESLSNCATVHHGHSGEVYVDDERHAHGIWVLEDYLSFGAGTVNEEYFQPSSTVRAFGHYFDTYLKVDEEWKIQSIDLYRLRFEQFTPTTYLHQYPSELRLPVPPASLATAAS